MLARLYPNQKRKSRIRRILGKATIGVVGAAIGASIPEAATGYAKTKTVMRIVVDADKFFATERPHNAEWEKEAGEYRALVKRASKIDSFRMTARPFYLSVGGLLGFLSALGIAKLGKRARLKAIKERFPDSQTITPEMYDSSEINKLVEQVNRALTQSKQRAANQALAKRIGEIHVPYLTETAKRYEYFIVLGNSIFFFNEPRKK